jgi:TatD DNase family protein
VAERAAGLQFDCVEIIDTHCHLDAAEFDADRQAVLARARANGVVAIVVPGVCAPGWDHLWRFCAGEPDLFPALGLHPVYLEQHQATDLAALERLLAEHRPVAVGEIGLDYYLTPLDRQRQQVLFEAQLQLARAAGLPVILHVRKAHDSVLATLKRIRVPGGIAHAYNGSLQQARQYMDLGFKLGFGGMLTYERSRRLRELARQLPVEAFVLETDAPDLTVAQHRGSRNSPEYLPHCLAALAEVRDESREGLARQTSANARAVLGLDSRTGRSG